MGRGSLCKRFEYSSARVKTRPKLLADSVHAQQWSATFTEREMWYRRLTVELQIRQPCLDGGKSGFLLEKSVARGSSDVDRRLTKRIIARQGSETTMQVQAARRGRREERSVRRRVCEGQNIVSQNIICS